MKDIRTDDTSFLKYISWALVIAWTIIASIFFTGCKSTDWATECAARFPAQERVDSVVTYLPADNSALYRALDSTKQEAQHIIDSMAYNRPYIIEHVKNGQECADIIAQYERKIRLLIQPIKSLPDTPCLPSIQYRTVTKTIVDRAKEVELGKQLKLSKIQNVIFLVMLLGLLLAFIICMTKKQPS